MEFKFGTGTYGITNPVDDTWYYCNASTGAFVEYTGNTFPSSISISSGIYCQSYYDDLVASFGSGN